MKCNIRTNTLIAIVGYGLFIIISLSCKESLPVNTFPDKVIALKVSLIEQLNDHQAPPGRQKVHIVITGENIYDEVFWDSVNIKGSLRIWWKRKPVRFRTIYLTEKNLSDRSMIHNGRMMLIPGQQFSMDAYWDIRSDNGMYLVKEMDFTGLSKRYCTNNVACGNTEDFVVELSLNVYDRLGYLLAQPKEFTFYPRVCVLPNYPPCGLGGGGGG